MQMKPAEVLKWSSVVNCVKIIHIPTDSEHHVTTVFVSQADLNPSHVLKVENKVIASCLDWL